MQKSNKSYFSNELLRRVSQNIQAKSLIQPKDTILVAVSGGADSVTLLHILHKLQPQLFQKLAVAHLNHNLRDYEAVRDAEFVGALCRDLSLPVHIKKVDVRIFAKAGKLNLEEAGRLCRYDFFNKLIQNYNYSKIALAHNANDNAELVLMNLLRGSGLLGISGMSFVRENTFIRPLLDITRDEIMKYIKINQLSYVTDSTNFDLKYTRNHIRHKLIPTLKRDFNSNIIETLNHFAIVTQSEEEWMALASESFFQKALLKKDSQRVLLASGEINKMHRAIVRRVLRKALKELKGDLRRIGFLHVESIITLLDQNSGYRQLHLPGGILIESENSTLQFSLVNHISRPNKKQNTTTDSLRVCYNVAKPIDGPINIHISELKCDFKFSIADHNCTGLLHKAGQNIAFFDMDRLVFPLLIRTPKIGDRFSPLGLNGTQKLKNFFINTKVPQAIRKRIPLVESKDTIIWIAGHRPSNYSKVRSHTKHVLKVEFFLPNPQQ